MQDGDCGEEMSRLAHGLQTLTLGVAQSLWALGAGDLPDERRQQLTAQGIGLLHGVELELWRASFAAGAKLAIRATSPNEILEHLRWTFDALRGLHAGRGARLELPARRASTANDSPSIDADPQALRIVFAAILGNALRYACFDRPGVVTVSLEIRGERFGLIVEDDGPGFEPEIRPHAFEPGTRGSRARAFAPNGTGRGLADARSLLRRMDGELLLLERSHGTALRCSLPWSAT